VKIKDRRGGRGGWGVSEVPFYFYRLPVDPGLTNPNPQLGDSWGFRGQMTVIAVEQRTDGEPPRVELDVRFTELRAET
jgi:hypothetical protein